MFSTVRPYRRFPCARLAPVKRLVLATLLILSSEPVYAEWVAVAMTPNGEMMVYADANTLRREGELVKWWELNSGARRRPGRTLTRSPSAWPLRGSQFGQRGVELIAAPAPAAAASCR